MKCAKARAHLGDHLEGDLELPDRREVDLHLAACPDCRRELSELRSTVALLRALPDPQPPEGLVASVMQRIDAGETRVARMPLPLRRVCDPRVAAPLAAGIAGLVLFATMEGAGPLPIADANGPVDVAGANAVEPAEWMWKLNPPTLGDRLEEARRAPAPSRVAAAKRAQAMRLFRPRASVPNVGFYGRTDPDPHYLDLDAQIDGALNQPEAFLQFVSQLEEADRSSLIAPLAVRAARRGDAQDVAGRLRRAHHPLAQQAAEPFERFGRSAARTVEAMPASHTR